MEFKRITLRLQGTMAWTQEYEIIRTPAGMKAAYYEGAWMYGRGRRESCVASRKTWPAGDYEELCGKLDELQVLSWDGYVGNNPHVMDGESFSLEIEPADGKTIYAHGDNAYPKNYNEFEALVIAACGQ